MPSCSPFASFENDPEADVTFQSADSVQFHLRRKYLELNTGAFPGAEFDTNGEITHLTEPSCILELLFRFVYPSRHPDLDGKEFRVVAALAEAAEKYEVFAAMNVCRMRMRQFLPEYAKEILQYATKHDYSTLIEDSLTHLVLLPLESMVEYLPARYLGPWIRFHSARLKIFSNAQDHLRDLRVAQPHSTKVMSYIAGAAISQACHSCLFIMTTTVRELQGMTDGKELEETLKKPRYTSTTCLSPMRCQYVSVMTKICEDISTQSKELPRFSTYL